MPKIYLVRHGQTDWNASLRLQGQEDTPLNDTGRGQASRNGAVLAKMLSNPDEFDFAASPLARTRETMEIVRKALDLPEGSYRTDDALKEIHFGDWQGRTHDELARDEDMAYHRFWLTPAVRRAPGGESFIE